MAAKSEREERAEAPPGVRVGPSSTSVVPPLQTTEERVSYIAERMSRGEWLGGYPMRVEIGQAWGVSESRIRDLASMAHQILAFSPERREELRAELAMTCQAILVSAKTSVSKISGLPDFRAALEAAVTVAKFVGIDLDPPERSATGDGALQVILTDEPGAFPAPPEAANAPPSTEPPKAVDDGPRDPP